MPDIISSLKFYVSSCYSLCSSCCCSQSANSSSDPSSLHDLDKRIEVVVKSMQGSSSNEACPSISISSPTTSGHQLTVKKNARRTQTWADFHDKDKFSLAAYSQSIQSESKEQSERKENKTSESTVVKKNIPQPSSSFDKKRWTKIQISLGDVITSFEELEALTDDCDNYCKDGIHVAEIVVVNIQSQIYTWAKVHKTFTTNYAVITNTLNEYGSFKEYVVTRCNIFKPKMGLIVEVLNNKNKNS